MSAVERLHRAGGHLRVLLVEARARIGGRVHTAPLATVHEGTVSGSAPLAHIHDETVSGTAPLAIVHDRTVSGTAPLATVVDVGAAWLHGGTAGANPLLHLLSPPARLHPVRGPSGSPLPRNPWTAALSDSVTVMTRGTGPCPASALSVADAVWKRVRAGVGARVRRCGEGELRGVAVSHMVQEEVERACTDAGVDDPAVMDALAAFQHLLGAWTGSDLSAVPAFEGGGGGCPPRTRRRQGVAGPATGTSPAHMPLSGRCRAEGAWASRTRAACRRLWTLWRVRAGWRKCRAHALQQLRTPPRLRLRALPPPRAFCCPPP